MSKERWLLQRVFSNWGYPRDIDLLKEIRECLAQPETKQELLAQPEQEPVAWMQDSIELYVLEEKSAIRGYVIPLYTAPPRREPLSDEEIFEIGYKAGFAIDSIERDLSLDYGFLDEDGDVDNEPYFKLVRAIEKAHGIGEIQ